MPTVDEMTQTNRVQQLLHTLGRAYLQKEQYAEAYEKFKQLLALQGDDSEILLDTAIAALGTNDASEQALGLYEKAIAHNPDSVALKLGLASLFVSQTIATPFAIEICKSAADLAPANEQQIRFFLKDYYEAAGELDKAAAEEQRAVFNSRDSSVVRKYLEKLWWDGRFADAYDALRSAPSFNGKQGRLIKELAITHAYNLMANDQRTPDTETIRTMLTALPSLTPAESFLDLRDYLTLRLSLMGDGFNHQKPSDDSPRKETARDRNGNGEPGDFVVDPFDLCTELLDPLARPSGEEKDMEVLDAGWRGFLFTQISTPGNKPVPDRLRNLFSTHLSQLPDSVLRQSENGLISIAQDPAVQIRAMVDFMLSLEEYNAAVKEEERVSLLGGLQVASQSLRNDERETLAALVDAAHLLRIAELTAAPETSPGLLLVRSENDGLAKIKNTGIHLLPIESVPLLPGKETPCAEVIWRNPLAQLKTGQAYTFGRFEIRKRLLKHNNYGTYWGIDTQLHRPLVMKIMMPQEAALFLQNDEQREQLYARIRAIARLSHPHLAFIFDLGEHEDMLYFGREYVEGKNLTELQFRDEQRDGEILAMLQKTVRALFYAYNKNITHLNLKPGNIWLSEAQDLKITDLRIPGFTEDAATASVLFPAHWRYLAPELLFGESGDTRSDIYSLGIIAYEMIAGHHPYNTASAIQSPKDVLKAHIAPLSQQRPHHNAWDDFIMKAVQRDADKRFFDLEEMDKELRQIQMEMLKKALNTGR